MSQVISSIEDHSSVVEASAENASFLTQMIPALHDVIPINVLVQNLDKINWDYLSAAKRIKAQQRRIQAILDSSANDHASPLMYLPEYTLEGIKEILENAECTVDYMNRRFDAPTPEQSVLLQHIIRNIDATITLIYENYMKLAQLASMFQRLEKNTKNSGMRMTMQRVYVDLITRNANEQGDMIFKLQRLYENTTGDISDATVKDGKLQIRAEGWGDDVEDDTQDVIAEQTDLAEYINTTNQKYNRIMKEFVRLGDLSSIHSTIMKFAQGKTLKYPKMMHMTLN